MSIMGNMVGAYSSIGKTLIIEDENGNQLTGVVTDKEVIFTAQADKDIREGTVAATDAGIVTGTKVIPSYHTRHGAKLVPAGSDFFIRLPALNIYDYTVFHGIICLYNTSMSNSVAAEKISILDAVYPVSSTQAISNIIKDDDTKSIVLGITNDTSNNYVLRYITYKEID